jgi:hypothetical protein
MLRSIATSFYSMAFQTTSLMHNLLLTADLPLPVSMHIVN